MAQRRAQHKDTHNALARTRHFIAPGARGREHVPTPSAQPGWASPQRARQTGASSDRIRGPKNVWTDHATCRKVRDGHAHAPPTKGQWHHRRTLRTAFSRSSAASDWTNSSSDPTATLAYSIEGRATLTKGVCARGGEFLKTTNYNNDQPQKHTETQTHSQTRTHTGRSADNHTHVTRDT